MKCSALRALLATLAVGVGTVPLVATAAEVSGLFTAEVEYDKSAVDGRKSAYGDALGRVIGRLIDRQSADPLAIEAVLEEPARWVIGYRDSGAERLWVSFDGPSLVAALRRQGVAVWGSDRPLTIVWLAVDRGGGEREILSSSSQSALGSRARRAEPADYLRERLEQAASDRGLPIVLPLMDGEDQSRVEFADVWGDFDEVLQEATARYGAVSILSGRAAPGQAEAIRWTWRFAGNDVEFVGGVERAVQRIGREMSAALALANPDDVRRVTVTVDAVDSVDGFGRLMQFLRRQPLIRRVDVLGMDRHILELELHYVGSMERIDRLLASFPYLEPITTPVQTDPSLAVLSAGRYFRLRN